MTTTSRMHPATAPDDGATKALALLGSLRAGSWTGALLDQLERVAGGRLDIARFDGLRELPAFDQDGEESPGSVVEALRAQIDAADLLVVVTPEYNASLPGHLKTAIDWASRPREAAVLRGKRAIVLGASPSPGGARSAVGDAVRILRRAGADVLGTTVTVPRAYEELPAGSSRLEAEISALLDEVLVDLTRAHVAA